MSKCQDFIHCIKDDGVLEHPIVVQLAKVLDFCDAPLAESEVVLFQSKAYRLDNCINRSDDKIGVITIQGTQQYSEKVDVAVFDLAGFRKDLLKDRNDLSIFN